MSRNAEVRTMMNLVLTFGDGAPSLEQKLALVARLRERSADAAALVDRILLDGLGNSHRGLAESRERLEGLEKIVEELTAPPLYPGTLRRIVDHANGPRAEVTCGGARRLVVLGPELEPGELAAGDEVMLNNQRNVVVERFAAGAPACGEVAVFQRWLADGRLVLKHRDEEIVVGASVELSDADLSRGDLVRWERSAELALEKMPAGDESAEFLMDSVPDIPLSAVGGHGSALRGLIDVLVGYLMEPELAHRYGISGQRTCLLVGPPGCGKTLMCRAAAAEISRMTGRPCSFGVVKPGGWENPYVGVTERKIRECFRALRKATEKGPALLVLDEVETVGRIRGGLTGRHADKALGALLAEVDGFEDRDNVAIVAATNRKDLMDEALVSRLGETEIQVPRPHASGAREIFNIHLPLDAPVNPNGSAARQTRRDIVETAVSLLYSPNAEKELCELHFRDNSTRRVSASDLLSGREIKQICFRACQTAYLREVRGGSPGVTTNDMRDAIAETLKKLRTTLTVRNAHAYLPDLPEDMDVVDVRVIDQKVDRPHRYINAPVIDPVADETPLETTEVDG